MLGYGIWPYVTIFTPNDRTSDLIEMRWSKNDSGAVHLMGNLKPSGIMWTPSSLLLIDPSYALIPVLHKWVKFINKATMKAFHKY